MKTPPSQAQKGLRSALCIVIEETTAGRVSARMPVGPAALQSQGLLHGGASVALAETAASVGGMQHVDQSKECVVGMEINANHLRIKRDGVVRATATPLHIGRRTQVWDVKITDEADNLVCVSRCTLAVVPVESVRGPERAS
jgi:uncharacterized protein (TIGR00369 family)